MADHWIAVKDQPPPQSEPVVYARPNPRRPGTWHVGIAYWSVSQRWNPEAEAVHAPDGFTHWKPLGPDPSAPTEAEYLRMRSATHDWPACAIFRGGRCTCDAQDATDAGEVRRG